MIDLSDLTVVIPVRVDSDERLANLEAVLRFLTDLGGGIHIILIESSPVSRLKTVAETYRVEFIHEVSTGPFHRTRLLNEGMTGRTSRSLVASYDADVLVFPAALETIVTRLRAGLSYGWPYDGHSFDVRGERRLAFLQTPGLDGIDPHALMSEGTNRLSSELVQLNHNSVGGVVIFRKDAFLDAGGYNEAFISWGWEDTELVERFGKLGHPSERVAGVPLLHLSHRRGPDSSPYNPFFLHNDRTYRRIRSMTAPALRAHVRSGHTKCAVLPTPTRLDRGLSRLRQALFLVTRKIGL